MAIIVTYTSHNEQKTCFCFREQEKALFERRRVLPSAHAGAQQTAPGGGSRALPGPRGRSPVVRVSGGQRPGEAGRPRGTAAGSSRCPAPSRDPPASGRQETCACAGRQTSQRVSPEGARGADLGAQAALSSTRGHGTHERPTRSLRPETAQHLKGSTHTGRRPGQVCEGGHVRAVQLGTRRRRQVGKCFYQTSTGDRQDAAPRGGAPGREAGAIGATELGMWHLIMK